MALRTSVGDGNWSVAGTWDTGVPVNGDTFAIAAGHTVTFDVDQSGMANGMGASTIAATGTLTASTAAGAYYLKMNGDLTVNGTLRAGTDTDTPYPSTCTFTIDFNSSAHSIERSATGSLLLYCTQPTYKYITTDAQALSGQPVLSVSDDVTADIWADGDVVAVIDSEAVDVQISTINAGGIAAGQITLADNLDSNVESDSIIVLVERNIKIVGVAANDYAITYASLQGDGDYIGAEIYTCNRGIYAGTGMTFAGVVAGCPSINLNGPVDAMISGCIVAQGGTATGISTPKGIVLSGLIAGVYNGISGGNAITISGRVFGCTNGVTNVTGVNLTTSAVVDYSTNGILNVPGVNCYGTIEYCGIGIRWGTDITIVSTTIGTNTSCDLREVLSGRAYNTIFQSGTEFYGYDGDYRSANAYFESFDHDQVENAFKAWCRGGVVTSSTTSPPTGYTIWYELAAEDTTQTYPVFRQYETVVLPGTAIEVAGKIRIAGGEDLSSSGLEPQLQIIDKFADPLVDSTQSPLDYDLPATVDGSETGWQDVSVIWANQGEGPRQVIVRMIAYNDGGVDDVDVDTVWSVASYQDQISEILNRVKRLGLTSEF